MKKITYIVILVLIVFAFSACTSAKMDSPILPEVDMTVETTLESTVEVTTEAIVPTQAEAVEPLRIHDIPVEDVIMFFNEVCLDAEVVNSGDPSFLQKWDAPIFYTLDGEYTQEDLQVITDFAELLNGIDGFPGMYPAETDSPNLRVHFCTPKELISAMGDDFTDMDGAVTFWYDENIIYDAQIYIRTDLHQSLRNSVILEEMYNGLGPIQDTSLREDSIIFSGFSEPQALTDMDELILKLLYHPEMQCGMDANQCEQAIRELYE